MRTISCLTAVIALAAVNSARADLPDGNYLLAQISGVGETTVCILTVKNQDGKPSVSTRFSPPNVTVGIKEFRTSGPDVSFLVTQTRTVQGRESTAELSFVGTVGPGSKFVLGNLGDDRFSNRARLSPTDKDSLTPAELVVRSPAAEAMVKVQSVGNRAVTLQLQAQREQDPEKRKALLAQVAEARKESTAKLPGLYRELIAKHPGTPSAFDAAQNLLRSAATSELPIEEAARLLAIIRTGAEPYGPRYVRASLTQLAELLIRAKGQEAAALAAIEPVARGLADSEKPSIQSRILTTYKTALERSGKREEARALEPRLAKIESALDAEYIATVPPFKPAKYAGRKEKGATQVAVLELFTGAQCPPCVAADVAFDALQKAYAPTDLVLIQYHMHIPGPDPLTNPDTIARWDYYKGKFASDVRGTPTTIFNGKPQAGGGGSMASSRGKYDQYSRIIDEILEKMTDVKVGGTAKAEGDQVSVTVDVTGMKEPKDSVKVRLILVEENIKYVGSNGLRFHHQVVRSLFDSPSGVLVKDLKDSKHSTRVSLPEVRQSLTKYLDEFAATRPFPYPARPLDLKGLKVIALVQDDATGEVLQAAQFDVGG